MLLYMYDERRKLDVNSSKCFDHSLNFILCMKSATCACALPASSGYMPTGAINHVPTKCELTWNLMCGINKMIESMKLSYVDTERIHVWRLCKRRIQQSHPPFVGFQRSLKILYGCCHWHLWDEAASSYCTRIRDICCTSLSRYYTLAMGSRAIAVIKWAFSCPQLTCSAVVQSVVLGHDDQCWWQVLEARAHSGSIPWVCSLPLGHRQLAEPVSWEHCQVYSNSRFRTF